MSAKSTSLLLFLLTPGPEKRASLSDLYVLPPSKEAREEKERSQKAAGWLCIGKSHYQREHSSSRSVRVWPKIAFYNGIPMHERNFVYNFH